MRFGVSVATHIANAGLAAHAEDLGFDAFWATDSQMMWSDVYSYLCLAAQETNRITLGPLVAVAPTRLAPVTAQSIATVNRLAPGRTALALGTAHTAMRTMGMDPMRVAAFGEYLRVVRALLRDEEVEYELGGRRHWIRFMHRDLDLMRLEPRVPIYVSAFGPRTQRLAGQFGDGVVAASGTSPDKRAALEANVRAGAEADGRALAGDFAYLRMAPLAVLMPGEPADSPAIVDAVGPIILSQFHAAWHGYAENPDGYVPPPLLRPGWEQYLAIVQRRDVPQNRQYIDIHEGHGTIVRDDERPLLTKDLISAAAIVGEPDELLERLRRIAAMGISEFILRIGLTNARETMSRFGQHVLPKL
ncbi:MAG: LLM class flavin-dependent oxidoreductase [Acidimicrobiales bacterium]|nr:LLM class flavin-dependent oxidoreductase [Acidimicrobiales bacterium]